MKIIPSSALKGLYVQGSLKSIQNGFQFKVDNKTKGIVLTKVSPIEIDGEAWPVQAVSFVTGDQTQQAQSISPGKPWPVPTGEIFVRVQGRVLGDGKHDVKLPFEARNVGRLELSFSDSVKF